MEVKNLNVLVQAKATVNGVEYDRGLEFDTNDNKDSIMSKFNKLLQACVLTAKQNEI